MHTQPFHGSVSFNAHHAPMGAYFSFTCGHTGTRGGMAAQLGKPANQDLHIGVKLGGRYETAAIRCLPFFDGAQSRMQDGPTAFTLEKPGGETDSLSAYHPREMRRHYGWATDTWKVGEVGNEDFEFSIFTPFSGIPEPGKATPDELRAALRPAVNAELVIDNRRGTQTKTAFFAINFNEGGARILDEGLAQGRVGFAWRSQYGVAAEAIELSDDNRCSRGADGCSTITPFVIMRWSVQQGLEDKSNPVHLLGTMPGVGIEVPPGKRVVLRLALGCYLSGTVTTRLEGKYLYTRHYSGLADVLNASLDDFQKIRRDAAELDARLENSGLSPDQQFLIAHATRSYYGNTQLLEIEKGGGEPYWIVNEGEYCMMNTLDLAVDQMFWELEQNPWVVRNVLDGFVKRYSYQDRVKIGANHEDTKNTKTHEEAAGGISFAHDQGVHNQFSPFGTSSYELKDLTGCFSYMTQEQLCNWILIAASYVARTNDTAWTMENFDTIDNCWASMLSRLAEPGTTNFIMARDSALTGSGSEITTYDSLDASLGQARASAYITVKCWVSYVALAYLESIFVSTRLKPRQFNVFEESLSIIIAGKLNQEKFVPAIFESSSDATSSRILPLIEGLAIILQFREHDKSGNWKWDELLSLDVSTGTDKLLDALRTHTITLLSDKRRRNHFQDGGIRLSSTSDNSWLSKIALVQHVARTLFNLDENGKERPQISNPKSQISDSGPAAGWEKSDAAHVKWLTEGESAYWAASDQFINGVAKGSRYYPRLITAALWLNK